MKCGRFLLALRTIEKANELLPNNSENLRALGWLKVILGKLDEGRQLLNEALRLDSQNVNALVDLAMSYIHFFEIQKGVDLLKKAQEMAPDDFFVKASLEIAHSIKVDFGKYSEKHLEKMRKEKLRPDILKEFRFMCLEQTFNGQLSSDDVEEIKEEWRLNKFPGKIGFIV